MKFPLSAERSSIDYSESRLFHGGDTGAMNKLAAIDARKSRLVELRYFGGLSVEEVAEVRVY